MLNNHVPSVLFVANISTSWRHHDPYHADLVIGSQERFIPSKNSENFIYVQLLGKLQVVQVFAVLRGNRTDII